MRKCENRKPRETAPVHSQNIEARYDSELKKNLRLEKVVAGKQLRLAVETRKKKNKTRE